MKRVAATAASTILLGVLSAVAQPAADSRQGNSGGPDTAQRQAVVVERNGSTPPTRGPETYFTGVVRVETPFRASAPARVSGGTVIFEAGAYSAWHTHPLGQTLIVTEGLGRVQEWGGVVQEIRPGDVVWIPPGVKHWHGAAPSSGMTHIAISEQLDGKSVDWLEKVSDDQYRN